MRSTSEATSIVGFSVSVAMFVIPPFERAGCIPVYPQYPQFVPPVRHAKVALSGVAIPLMPGVVQSLLSRRKMRSSVRSEEHTFELQSLMRISYAVYCLKTKQHKI